MNRQELLKNKGYWISKIQIDLYNHFEKYMKENKLNRTQIAKQLGVTKGYITQVLNGDFNHRISKLVELSLAINRVPEINFRDIEEYIQADKSESKSISQNINVDKAKNLNIVSWDESESHGETMTSLNSKAESDESKFEFNYS